jgi:hypothetical protein
MLIHNLAWRLTPRVAANGKGLEHWYVQAPRSTASSDWKTSSSAAAIRDGLKRFIDAMTVFWRQLSLAKQLGLNFGERLTRP